MTDIKNFPTSERLEMAVTRADHEALVTRSALLCIAELLEIASPDTDINLGNLSCMVTIVANRMPDPD